MERIQIALDKARADADREPQGPRSRPRRPVPAPPVPAPAAGRRRGAARPAARPSRPGAAAPGRRPARAVGRRGRLGGPARGAHRARAASSGRTWSSAVGGPESGAFDVMRTKLLHQMRAQGWRRIGDLLAGARLRQDHGGAQPRLRPRPAGRPARSCWSRPTCAGRRWAALLGLRTPRGLAEVLGGAIRRRAGPAPPPAQPRDPRGHRPPPQPGRALPVAARRRGAGRDRGGLRPHGHAVRPAADDGRATT